MTKFLKRYGPFITLGSLIVALGVFMWIVTSTLYASTREDVSGFRSEISGLRMELREDVGSLRTEFAGLRTDVNTRIGGLRTEIVGLRSDLKTSIATMIENQRIWQADIEKRLATAGQPTGMRIVVVDQDGQISDALMKAMQRSGVVSNEEPPAAPGKSNLRVPTSTE